jgi:hypothetical protein
LTPSALSGGNFLFIFLLPSALSGGNYLFIFLLPSALSGGSDCSLACSRLERGPLLGCLGFSLLLR